MRTLNTSLDATVVVEATAIAQRLAKTQAEIAQARSYHSDLLREPGLDDATRRSEAQQFASTVMDRLYRELEQVQHARMAFYARTRHLPTAGAVAA